MPWRQLLLESHTIAVISATGFGLLAFAGEDLARNAQPALARIVATAEPDPDRAAVSSKGPHVRLTSSARQPAGDPATAPAPIVREERPAPRPRKPQPAPPADRRAFEACLHAHEDAPCRRAFEAAIGREGGFALAPAGYRLGSQPPESLSSLDFADGPRWRRTLESVSHQGITFKRLRRGSDHELSFGINRDGVLGFTLQERRESDR